MTHEITRDGSDKSSTNDIAARLPDDVIAAILATDPDVTVNELLRARAKGRRLLAIYQAGATQAKGHQPPSVRS